MEKMSLEETGYSQEWISQKTAAFIPCLFIGRSRTRPCRRPLQVRTVEGVIRCSEESLWRNPAIPGARHRQSLLGLRTETRQSALNVFIVRVSTVIQAEGSKVKSNSMNQSAGQASHSLPAWRLHGPPFWMPKWKCFQRQAALGSCRGARHRWLDVPRGACTPHLRVLHSLLCLGFCLKCWAVQAEVRCRLQATSGPKGFS